MSQVRFDGGKFRAERERTGTTRIDAALAAGKSYPTIEAYESGRIQPPIATAAALADLVGVALTDLLTRTPEAVPA